MKNRLSLFVATLATLFSFLAASAQGEWKWAHCWSGAAGAPSDHYNTITKTAFDEDGNIYIWGIMGGQPTFNGSTFLFINNPQVYGSGRRASLLAKFDTLGNMLWYKVVKSSERECYSHWMEVKDNKVYISGNLSLGDVDHDVSTWLYYFDTLITASQAHAIPEDQRLPPYKPGVYTYFATFDLDGNLLDNHFVNALTREYVGGDIRGEEPLCLPNLGCIPVHVDNEGNTYVFTRLGYNGGESDPYTIQIDGDTNRKYDIYLPGNVNLTQGCLYTGMMYKFSPSWELLYAKPMVDHTEGIATSWELLHDSINPRFNFYIQGLSVDESDNMYVSGYISLDINGANANLHQYPVQIYWDSTHYSSLLDESSCLQMSFVVKYSTNGSVLWCNQIYNRGSNNTGSQNYVRSCWKGCVYYNHQLYVLGHATVAQNGIVFFDDESHPLQHFSNNRPTTGFFVGFDAETGQYANQGIVPASLAIPGQIPAAINNRIFAFSNVNNSYRIISEWCVNGEYITSDSILSQQGLADASIIANENGFLLTSFSTASPSVSFSDNVSVNCPSGQSSAVFALYHNPELTQPFVPDDSVGIDEYYQNREREIYLYPNPTDGQTTVCGYMYGYRSIELLDLQGRKLATLLDSPHGTSLPEIDLSPYPAGTYLVKINFERGVSVVRKVVKR